MAPPNSFKLPDGIYIEKKQDGKFRLSQAFIHLFIEYRSEYEWPSGIGKNNSQRFILDLENFVSGSLENLSLESAHKIVKAISKWGGNNKNSQLKIDDANPDSQRLMMIAIENLSSPASIKDSLNLLSELPGIRLVIASKVFRFCNQILGSSLDRHSSYFFNSLEIIDTKGIKRKSTEFKREWSTGKRCTSRLAIYSQNSHKYNLNEYVEKYLPLLRNIADTLNSKGIFYTCAATGERKQWRPADIEMAAYYYCAKGEHK